MKTLVFLSVCALAAVCTADSSESNEIDDVLFLGRRDAHSFMRQPRPPHHWDSRVRYKSPREMTREICEEHRPCERLARQVGLKRAYGRYFGGRRQRPSSYERMRPRKHRDTRYRNHHYRF
ncbi:matrix Gla protein-like isoform X2 [Scyliorhinus canicula]|uniref:matrix Gla protein-like isoform X2 n=1 Tax=Scyliorhinus canicula TaxID=7830 RepID=UPI0018F65162|nr:matrix Gla protein-like isoform X2 [Scyliorhinus canicula]